MLRVEVTPLSSRSQIWQGKLWRRGATDAEVLFPFFDNQT